MSNYSLENNFESILVKLKLKETSKLEDAINAALNNFGQPKYLMMSSEALEGLEREFSKLKK